MALREGETNVALDGDDILDLIDGVDSLMGSQGDGPQARREVARLRRLRAKLRAALQRTAEK